MEGVSKVLVPPQRRPCPQTACNSYLVFLEDAGLRTEVSLRDGTPLEAMRDKQGPDHEDTCIQVEEFCIVFCTLLVTNVI